MMLDNEIKMRMKKEVVARSSRALFMALLFAVICIFFFSTLVSADLYLNSKTGSIYFNTTGISRASIGPGGNFSINTSDFFVNNNLGRVGIGTVNPTGKLDVIGAGNFSGNVYLSGPYNVSFSDVNTGLSWDSGTEFIRRGSGSDQLEFGTQSSIRLYIAQGGNVGIGTSTPSALLHVNGTGALLNVTSGSTAVLFANGSGVSVGTTNLSNALTVRSASATPMLVYGYALGTANDYRGEILIGNTATYQGKISYDGADIYINNTWANTAADIYFQTGAKANVLALTGSGNVGIGTSTPSNTLDVRGVINASSDIYFNNGTKVGLGNLSGGGTSGYIPQWSGGATLNNSVIFQNSSYIGIGTTSPSYILDVVETNGLSVRSGVGQARSVIKDGTFYPNIDGSTLYYFSSAALSLGYYGATITTPSTYGGNLTITTGNNDNVIINPGIGKVGIGTNAPSAKLHINGTGALLNISSGSTSAFFVNASNVGIGTATPQAPLHVYKGSGNTAVTEQFRLQDTYSGGGASAGDGPLMRFTNYHGSGTNPNTGEYNLAGIGAYDYDTNWGGALAFYSAPAGITGGANLTQRMTIIPNGNVGIGTVTPSHTLNVVGTGNITGTTYLASNLFVNSSSVGIGTTSPTNKLHILKSSSISDYQNTAGLGIYSGTTDNALLIGADSTNDVSYLQTSNVGIGYAHNLALQPSAGNVGIGTTTPSNKLNVIGDINASGGTFYGAGTGLTGTAASLTSGDSQKLNGQAASYYTDIPSRLGYTPSQSASSSNSIFSLDSRNINYNASNRDAGLYADFKDNTVGGLSDGGSYHGVLTFRSYGGGADLSGGYPIQIAYTANGNLWIRMATGATTWGSWYQMARDQMTNNFSFMGNVGIGTTTPSNKLDVRGSINASGPIYFNNGTAVGAGVGNVSGGGATGYLSQWANASTLNNSVIYQNGTNLGIRTTNPNDLIEVYGEDRHLRFTNPTFVAGGGPTGSQYIKWFIESPSVQAAAIGYNSVSGAFNISTSGARPMLFLTNSVERMIITHTGNVGIGTSAPIALLHVNITSASSVNIANNSNSLFFVNGTTGNVGIRTTTPGAALNIFGDNQNIRFENDVDGVGQFIDWYAGETPILYSRIGFDTDLAAIQINNTGGGPIIFSTSASERMRLTNTGLGIGTAVPSALFHVNGTAGGFTVTVNGTMPTLNTTMGKNMTITSAGGSVIIQLG